MIRRLLPKPVMFLLINGLLLMSCQENDYPKPRGYLRIDLPEKTYLVFDTNFPYLFEYPVYSTVVPDPGKNAEPYWINIHFQQFRGTLHLSYKPVKNNLNLYIEDARTLAMKHIPKASGIETQQFVNPEAKVYGLIYTISGTGAASPLQFFVTDSVHHFVRGALYFNAVPNNDSLAPVIDFIGADIKHLIETLQWK